MYNLSLLNANLLLIILFLFKRSFAANICDFNVKVRQILQNEGFHRNITYSIVFTSDRDDEQWLYEDCTIGLDQTLPAGVYANPDELSDLKRINKLQAIPINRINVELPTEQSEPSSVFIIGPVTGGEAHLWLPVHARYHQAVTGGSMARNEIDLPKLYLRCLKQRLDECSRVVSSMTFLCDGNSKEKCKWKEIAYTAMWDTLVWDVPVGNTDHYYSVATGTAAAVAAGSLYLLKAIHEHKIGARRKTK